MASYLHRLAAIEERLGVKRCERLCLKCRLAQLPVVRMPSDDWSRGDWAGCDGRPMNLTELLHEFDAHQQAETFGPG